MEQIFLKMARQEVDKKYVGFQPNSGSVKPVHIASGAQRCIYGSFNRSKSIKKMALVSDSKVSLRGTKPRPFMVNLLKMK